MEASTRAIQGLHDRDLLGKKPIPSVTRFTDKVDAVRKIISDTWAEHLNSGKADRTVADDNNSDVKGTKDEFKDTLSQTIGQLTKFKRAAKMLEMGVNLEMAISKAKSVLEAGKGTPDLFKKIAKQFKGKNEDIRSSLLGIASYLEPVKVQGVPKEQKASTDLLQRIKQLGGIDGSLSLT